MESNMGPCRQTGDSDLEKNLDEKTSLHLAGRFFGFSIDFQLAR
jgi:hypothetical protein